MAKRAISILKEFFETGDIPTEDQYSDFMDSFYHKDEGEVITARNVQANGDVSFTFSGGDTITIEQFTLPATMPISFIEGLADAIGANIGTASNGLTKEGQDVKLGGTLTDDTTIEANTNVFRINQQGSNLEISEGFVGLTAEESIEFVSNLVFAITAKDVSLAATSNFLVNSELFKLKANITEIEGTQKLIVKPSNYENAPIGSVLTKINSENEAEWQPAYIPSFNLSDIGGLVLMPAESKIVNIKGEFMDTITEVTFEGLTDNSNVSVSIESKTFTNIEVELAANAIPQNYKLTLKSAVKEQEIIYQAINFDNVVPVLFGTTPELWVKPEVTNNDAVISEGIFESQNVNGDGWNDHAYFGAVSSLDQIRLSFTLDRLFGVAGAYCHVKLDNNNVPTTSGNARLYIQNGNTLLCYDPEGSIIATKAITEGDFVEVIYSLTEFKIYINNQEVAAATGNYSLNNIYVNFTAFRVSKITNISLKVF